MTNFKTRLFMSAVIGMMAGTAMAQSDVPTDPESVPGRPGLIPGINAPIPEGSERYVIRYKNNGKSRVLKKVKQGKGILNIEAEGLNMFSAVIPKGYAKSLKGNPNIESIEIDPKRYLMAEETPYGIPMVQANQLSDAGTGNQKVCIMDTGYDRQHVDLQSTRVTGNNNSQTGPWYNDGDGHGTHVAGTIAALGGNNEGVVGVVPGNKLNLHIIKVFDNSGNWAYGSDLAKAVDQCINAGSTVISMSLGGEGSSAAEEAAFEKAKNAGLISVAAAGNDGITALNYPASYDSVISVAAVNSSGVRPNWSQYNAQVEISAPGVDVKSTTPNNAYDTYSGTSMATPHVSGVAALVWSHYPDCTNEQIRAALNNSAEDKGTAGRDNKYGYGIVKAKAAFDLLKQGCDTAGGGGDGGGGDGGGGGGGGTTPPADDVLENGVAKTGLSGASDDRMRFYIRVPAGATNLKFAMTGGGDADLYVRKQYRAQLTSYDCRPYEDGSNETCNFASPEPTVYHVLVHGYSAFNNVSLTASYDEAGTDGGNQAPVARWWHRCEGLSCKFAGKPSYDDDGEIVRFRWQYGDGTGKWGMNTSHVFASGGTYKTILSVVDDQGAVSRRSKFISIAEVSASGVSVSAARDEDDLDNQVDLNWSGLSGKEVDVYADGYLADFTDNDGEWTDNYFDGAKGAHKYKVCEYGSTTKCSKEIKVTLE